MIGVRSAVEASGWLDGAAGGRATLGTMSEAATAPGAIRVDHVNRRFRVYPQPVRTLKEMLVARGRAKGRDVEALTDVSFAVEPGEAVGLIGRNGSGKTTLLKIVAGIIKPSDGRVAVGDEEFQRKCFGKIHEFKQRGGTIVFVSHDAAAVERLCTRAVLLREGRLVFDGPVREAITRYHAQLADERDPEERGAGLSEYGSGEVRITEATLLGADGEVRSQFSPGETLAVVLRVVSARPVPAPRLSYELHDQAGLQLGGGVQDTADLGWSEERAEHTLRLEIDGLPLADGRFRFRFELSDAAGGHLYHWLDDAARFVVYPGDGETGLVRLDARWSLTEDQATATIAEP